MKRLKSLILVLVVAALGSSARAQDLPTTETTQLDLSPYLQHGKPIRISGNALHRVGGYVVGLESDKILLGTEKTTAPAGAREIKLQAVDTLWSRSNWLWPGLALGSSVGGFVGGAICVFGQAEECIAFPAAVVGGLAIGAAVGLARKVWKERFVRRDGGPVPTIGSFNPR
jgi:hypothetical protein